MTYVGIVMPISSLGTRGECSRCSTVGYTLSDGHYSTDTNHGMALTLVACELGYDCSWDNPAMQATACEFNYAHPCQGYTDYPAFLAATSAPASE